MMILVSAGESVCFGKFTVQPRAPGGIDEGSPHTAMQVANKQLLSYKYYVQVILNQLCFPKILEVTVARNFTSQAAPSAKR